LIVTIINYLIPTLQIKSASGVRHQHMWLHLTIPFS